MPQGHGDGKKPGTLRRSLLLPALIFAGHALYSVLSKRLPAPASYVVSFMTVSLLYPVLGKLGFGLREWLVWIVTTTTIHLLGALLLSRQVF